MSVVLAANRPPAEPWLVYDARQQLAAQGKVGLHALIAGVSAYRNLPSDAGLGMLPLTSTSLTAYLMFVWLLQAHEQGRLPRPLATCRMLLTPTPGEATESVRFEPGIQDLGVPGCTVSALQDAAEKWRADASRGAGDGTLFYFAGHGIQKSRNNQVLLLESFGGPGPLARHSVDVSSLRNGMAPSAAYPNIARTQFYFIDACRSLPTRILSMADLQVAPVFDVLETGLDDRRAPIFFASLPDGKAQAVPGQQTLFSKALLRCLAGRAAFPPDRTAADRAQNEWYVSTQSLTQGLPIVLEEVNREHGGDQRWTMDGSGDDAVLCYMRGPPTVPLQIEVDPPGALPCTAVSLTSFDNPATDPLNFRYPTDEHPFRRDLAPGVYRISATQHTADPRFRAQDAFSHSVEPLRCRTRVRMLL
ncbi:caspase family protein [Variovorax sp. LjRoot84]|uniref:caspase family protein n=1 Tax=Variovorax sp. LjRoot84 TaxID=3342340 RepID=UPI003ECDBFB5